MSEKRLEHPLFQALLFFSDWGRSGAAAKTVMERKTRPTA
ncbi:hypothetical protein GTCCBUS3UF5_31560 [Geobacillus thermoleovorans CCB_US3_UF5]|uniref:Uncharacterized protein n=2 Tax=Geobacillus thermoleovorans group TaxID=1505648 RepID=U2X0I8_GEOKU|nr:hypothetical protein GTCCBUS3UF5_31560 [Geobacillus thermoleovorans CCB_US3_UF5]EQB95539.1 hypothetical protein GA8_10420 [Geobacillus sp. A8]GAD11880.1 hypothetical protein GBL_0097 [Geobacillus kaustophilus GBlys]